jgi:hypothetical protein
LVDFWSGNLRKKTKFSPETNTLTWSNRIKVVEFVDCATFDTVRDFVSTQGKIFPSPDVEKNVKFDFFTQSLHIFANTTTDLGNVQETWVEMLELTICTARFILKIYETNGTKI